MPPTLPQASERGAEPGLDGDSTPEFRKCSRQYSVSTALCKRPGLRQSHGRQPEVVDAAHQILECIQLHWLGEVAIRLQLIAFRNVRIRLRSRQDYRRDRF